MRRHYIYNAHAMGVYHGRTYTNCREAFEKSYNIGFRNFETDISITADKKYVLSHRTNEMKCITEKEFLDMQESGTPLTLNDLFDIMRRKPDVRIMFDFLPGYYDHSIPDIIKDFSRKLLDADLDGRYILEVYSIENLLAAREEGLQKELQMAIDISSDHKGAFGDTADYICFLKQSGVSIISVSMDYVINCADGLKQFHDNGFVIYSPGWNSRLKLWRYPQTRYIDFITTDYLRPCKIVINRK